jgi:hypothetical protein
VHSKVFSAMAVGLHCQRARVAIPRPLRACSRRTSFVTPHANQVELYYSDQFN